MKTKFKHIYDPVHLLNFFYCSADSLEKYRSVFKKTFGVESSVPDLTDGVFETIYNLERDVNCGVIWAKNNEVDTLAHECLHAVFWALALNRDCRLTQDTEESYAYLIQFIMKECLSNKVEKDIEIRKPL